MRPTLPRTIIAADWGKSEGKRRAVRIDTGTLTVESVPARAAASLEGLLTVVPERGTLIAPEVGV